MRYYDKVKSICYRYGVYFDGQMVSTNTDYFLLRKCMLKMYEQHKDINFETFVREFYNNPLEYAYNLYQMDTTDEVEVHVLNNCFNDKHKKHFGCKYKNHWFFISHSNNQFSLPIPKEYSYFNYDDRPSYLVSYSGVKPNIIENCRGKIKRFLLEEYINKFL